MKLLWGDVAHPPGFTLCENAEKTLATRVAANFLALLPGGGGGIAARRDHTPEEAADKTWGLWGSLNAQQTEWTRSILHTHGESTSPGAVHFLLSSAYLVYHLPWPVLKAMRWVIVGLLIATGQILRPAGQVWGRSSAAGETALCVLMIVQAMVILTLHPEAPGAKRVIRLLPGPERKAFTRGRKAG